ncbi:MAG: hypothetical protein M3M94_04295 [Actinomycetota bacterium]|nr:hypothetical protein [Actinomycetota bacterium]
MARLVSTALVLGLLGGTAAAFAVTEGLKLERSPVTGPRIDNRIFSPLCDCPFRVRGRQYDTSVTHISVRMLVSEFAAISIQDAEGNVVRTLERRRFRKGRTTLEWDGRDDGGRLVPEGTYKPRIEFAGQHRTIVLPNPIRIDTTPPRVSIVEVSPRLISPNRDGRGEVVYVRYRVNEPARPDLLAPGGVRVHARFARPTGVLQWFGRVAGRGLRHGTYRLALVARDLAGNVSRRTPPVFVRVRYIELSPQRVRVRPGGRARVHISTDAVPVEWRLGRRSGRTRSRVLSVRAPSDPGRYPLVVSIKDRTARALVVVARRP